MRIPRATDIAIEGLFRHVLLRQQNIVTYEDVEQLGKLSCYFPSFASTNVFCLQVHKNIRDFMEYYCSIFSLPMVTPKCTCLKDMAKEMARGIWNDGRAESI